MDHPKPERMLPSYFWSLILAVHSAVQIVVFVPLDLWRDRLPAAYRRVDGVVTRVVDARDVEATVEGQSVRIWNAAGKAAPGDRVELVGAIPNGPVFLKGHVPGQRRRWLYRLAFNLAMLVPAALLHRRATRSAREWRNALEAGAVVEGVVTEATVHEWPRWRRHGVLRWQWTDASGRSRKQKLLLPVERIAPFTRGAPIEVRVGASGRGWVDVWRSSSS